AGANPAGKGNLVTFDYGKTIGIDVNKALLVHAAADGTCPGYFEEGVVVRDNFVFNHGHTGFSVAGKWVRIVNNNNDRLFLQANDNVYGVGPSGPLTLDGWRVADPASDNKSRAFDLAGRTVWVHGHRFRN